MSTNKRTIIKHSITAMLLTGAALAAPTTFAANTGDYAGDSCAACHGAIQSGGGSSGGVSLSVSKSSASNILNKCKANAGGMAAFCGAYTNAQANAVALQLGGKADLATGATATPTTKPATATPTTKPAITATPTTKPATATPTTKPAITATPTTKPAITATPTPKPATSTPVPGPTAGKTVSGSVGSSTSGAAATDVFAVTCGKGTVGLDVAITDNTSPAPLSLLTIQAVKDNAANIITAGAAAVIASSNDDDDDDDDSASSSASQLNKGAGVYTVLVSKQLSDAVGAEVYSANVNCVGSSRRAPSISISKKQDQ